MRRLLKKPALLILLCCYGAALLVWLGAHLYGFIANRIAYANGTLACAELSVDDFELEGLERQPDGTLLTLDSDPKLLLKDTARRVENVVLQLSYTRQPFVRSVLWAGEGEDYSLRRVAYPRGAEKDSYLLAPAGGTRLRIDPDSAAGNIITVWRIAINTKRPFYAFFIPSGGEAALVLAVPGLLAALLYSLRCARLWPRRHKKRKAGDAP